MRRRAGEREGMSLLELLATLLILAVLLALAYPSWQRFQAQQSLRYAAAQVATDLREAQERAKAERRPYRAIFTSGSPQYRVEAVAGGFVHQVVLGGCESPTTHQPIFSARTCVKPTGDATVQFSAFGRPDGSYSIVLQNAAGTATVTVTGGGGIQYDAP